MGHLNTLLNDQATSTLDNYSYSYSWVPHANRDFEVTSLQVLFQNPTKLENIVVKGFATESMGVMEWSGGVMESLTSIRILNISSRHFESNTLIKTLCGTHLKLEELTMTSSHLDILMKAFKKGKGGFYKLF